MTEITNELIYEILKTIQAGQSETTRKIGSLAEALVRQTKRIDLLTDEVSSMRSDIHTIALAVDEHTERLASLEGKTTPSHS